jgi:hypothetical protein
MGSRGKRKTTMAKLARENRLRERRLNKEAQRDARKPVSSDHLDLADSSPESGSGAPGISDRSDEPASAPVPAGNTGREVGHLDGGPSDPRDKEVALLRLRDASDEKLAVFETKLRNDALDAGASEREMRDAQRTHPGHGA